MLQTLVFEIAFDFPYLGDKTIISPKGNGSQKNSLAIWKYNGHEKYIIMIAECLFGLDYFSCNINQSNFLIHNRITYNTNVYYTIFEQFESSGCH